VNDLYDPARASFSPTAPPLLSQFFHTATLLPGNQVLLAGGWSQSAPTSQAQVFEASTGRFRAVGSMTVTRQLHAASLLQDGSVLISGGSTTANVRVPVAERYTPAAGQFTLVAPLLAARAKHTATTLPDGRVLIVGGTAGGDNGIFWLDSVELFARPQ
jgi:hypothetical protein